MYLEVIQEFTEGRHSPHHCGGLPHLPAYVTTSYNSALMWQGS